MEELITQQLAQHRQQLEEKRQQIGAYRQAIQHAEAEALALTGAIATLEDVLQKHRAAETNTESTQDLAA